MACMFMYLHVHVYLSVEIVGAPKVQRFGGIPYLTGRKFSDFTFPDATETILDSLKSVSDDEEADNTDNDEEQG